MSSRHFLTIFWRRRTDDADANTTLASPHHTKSRFNVSTVDIEIIIRHVLAKRNCGASVITEMEDSGLDTKPAWLVSALLTEMQHPVVYISGHTIGDTVPKQQRYAYQTDENVSRVNTRNTSSQAIRTFCLSRATPQ